MTVEAAVNASIDSAVADEVLAGLARTPKQIAPKYFYDKKGSALFDAITELDEYYLPRVEKQIFAEYHADICAAIGTGKTLVEPGAGSCEKFAGCCLTSNPRPMCRWTSPEITSVPARGS